MLSLKNYRIPYIEALSVICSVLLLSCRQEHQNEQSSTNQQPLKTVSVKEAEPSKTTGRVWRNIDDGIEGVTTFYNKEQCEQNKRLFEGLVPVEELNNYESGTGIGSFEHFCAIKDLIALYSDSTLMSEPLGPWTREIDDLVVWRLQMFYHIENNKGLKPEEPRVTPCDFTYEGMRILMCQIDSVLNYEPYTSLDIGYQMGLTERLYETFVNVLYDRFRVNHGSFYENEILSAAAEEYKAFMKYREACHECAFALINPTTSLPSTTLSTSVEIENMKLQTLSLLYSVVNFNPVEKHATLPGQYSLVESEKVRESDVLNEYARLAKSQKEDDTFEEDTPYRQMSVKERRILIDKEKKAWTDWLKASHKLSEYADAEIYQRSMNLVLKHKWRMLNNQYEDMTIYSGDQEKCFLGEDCTVSQLKESCYAERWDQLY